MLHLHLRKLQLRLMEEMTCKRAQISVDEVCKAELINRIKIRDCFYEVLQDCYTLVLIHGLVYILHELSVLAI